MELIRQPALCFLTEHDARGRWTSNLPRVGVGVTDELYGNQGLAGLHGLQAPYRVPDSGKQKKKSAKTTIEKDAWKAAAKLEEELRSGSETSDKITWKTFRDRYETEKLDSLAPVTKETASASLNHLRRVLELDKDKSRLAKINSAAMTRFQTKLRQEGMKDTTLRHHLRHIRTAFRWAERQGLMAKAPMIEMPNRARGQGSEAKSRAIIM